MDSDCVTLALYSGFSSSAGRLPVPNDQSHKYGRHAAIWQSGPHTLTMVINVSRLNEKILWVDAELKTRTSPDGSYTARVVCVDLMATEHGVKRLDALVDDFLRVGDTEDGKKEVDRQ